jgi:hypothetical protein
MIQAQLAQRQLAAWLRRRLEGGVPSEILAKLSQYEENNNLKITMMKEKAEKSRVPTKRARVFVLSVTMWCLLSGMHSWDKERQSREDFANMVTAKSDYQFVVWGWDSRSFAIVTTDSDPVACGGFVSAIIHEKEDEPVRTALAHEGFKRISCGDVTANLP